MGDLEARLAALELMRAENELDATLSAANANAWYLMWNGMLLFFRPALHVRLCPAKCLKQFHARQRPATPTIPCESPNVPGCRLRLARSPIRPANTV